MRARGLFLWACLKDFCCSVRDEPALLGRLLWLVRPVRVPALFGALRADLCRGDYALPRYAQAKPW